MVEVMFKRRVDSQSQSGHEQRLLGLNMASESGPAHAVEVIGHRDSQAPVLNTTLSYLTPFLFLSFFICWFF